MTQIVYIEGNIGSGKTTFINLLGKHLNNKFRYTILREPVDQWISIVNSRGENLLELFYRDQDKWSFAFQMNSFISRVKDITNIVNSNQYDIVFVERSVYVDRYCFALNCYESGKMTEIEYKIYCQWHDWLSEHFHVKPFGYIYLKTDPEISLSRITRRLRRGEESIPLEYLQSLHNKHNDLLEAEENNNVRVLNLDVTYDFDNSPRMNEFANSIIDAFLT